MSFFLCLDDLSLKGLDGLAGCILELFGLLGSVELLVADVELDSDFAIGLFGGIKNLQLYFGYADFGEAIQLAQFLGDVRIE